MNETTEEYVQMILDMDHDDKEMGASPWKEAFVRQIAQLFSTEEDFVLRLSTVASLLDRKIGNLKRTLTANFVEGRDYIIDHVASGNAGRPSEDLRLAVGAFKRLVMMLRGPKADALRGYFAMVEEAYREGRMDQIAHRRSQDSEEATQEKMKLSLRGAAKFPVGHCVYVVRVVQEDGVVKHKVGRSKDLHRRFGELRRLLVGQSVTVAHQRMIPDDVYLESCVHSLLKTARLDHEVEMFLTDINVIFAALDACEEVQQRIKADFESRLRRLT